MNRWLWLVALPLATVSFGSDVDAQEGEDILNANCAACHERTDGGLARIRDQRKTPEA